MTSILRAAALALVAIIVFPFVLILGASLGAIVGIAYAILAFACAFSRAPLPRPTIGLRLPRLAHNNDQ